MAASTFDITIEQNTTFKLIITWVTNTTPQTIVNLTGYTAKMQIRPAIGSPTVLATLTDSNGGIILGGTAGTITLFQTATQTLAYTWLNGVYDLEVVSPTGFATRLLEGNVIISEAVTMI